MRASVTTYRTEHPPAAPDDARVITLVDRRHERSLRVVIRDGAPARDEYDVAVDQRLPQRTPRYARVGVHHGDPMRDVSPAPLQTLHGLAGTMMLIDRASGRGLGFVFFESEQAMLDADEIVSAAPAGTAGATSSVDLYEVVEFT